MLAEVDKINTSGVLPAGVRIERIYDRKDLIDITTHTVLHNMVMGIMLIFLHPVAVPGRPALRADRVGDDSLRAFFAVVDPDVERRVGQPAVDGRHRLRPHRRRHGDHGREHLPRSFRDGHAQAVARPRRAPRGKLATIFHAATEVTQAIFFSADHHHRRLLAAVHAVRRRRPHLRPDGQTYAYALSGGLLATFTVSPALCALCFPTKVDHAETRAGARPAPRSTTSCCDVGLAHRRGPLAAGARRRCVAVLVGSTIGLEFLPKLEEGNMWIRAAMPASISLEAGNDYANRMRQLIKSFPEAETVISQHGRPDDGTDSTGFFNAEFFVPLRPSSSGARASTRTA